MPSGACCDDGTRNGAPPRHSPSSDPERLGVTWSRWRRPTSSPGRGYGRPESPGPKHILRHTWAQSQAHPECGWDRRSEARNRLW
jgi:hypothetical protein